jgi:hypothetical protein
MKLSCRRVGVGCWAIVGIALLGCGGESGPPTARLQGAVTLAGQPIPADATGMISFQPRDKAQGAAASAEIVGGKYDCPKAPLGPVTVLFNITQPTGPEYTSSRGEKVRDSKSLTPLKYGSGTPLEVTGDNAALDFDLTE